MRHVLALVTLVALLLFLVAAGPERAHVTRFSVTIENEFAGGQGSGVLVREGVLTAYHVVDLDESEGLPVAPVLKCTTADGREFIAQPVLVSPAQDLALLSCDLDPDIDRAHLGDQPEQGAPVVVVGSGFHFRNSVKHGYVANWADGDLLLDVRIGPGDSGCAVLNEDEDLVGMVRAVHLLPPFVGYGVAVDVDQLREFLGQADPEG